MQMARPDTVFVNIQLGAYCEGYSNILFLEVLCSGKTVLTAVQGSFGVEHYVNDMSCEWLIQLPVDGVSIPKSHKSCRHLYK